MTLSKGVGLIKAPSKGFDSLKEEGKLMICHEDLWMIVGLHHFVKGVPEIYISFTE
jgi:hypothetical protein